MKQIIIFIALLLTTVSANAQEVYKHFLVEGKSWVYKMYAKVGYWSEDTPGKKVITNSEDVYYDRTYTLRGDTVINSMTYSKLIMTEPDTSYIEGYYREEEGMLLKYSKENGDKLVYNFTYKIGDKAFFSVDGIENHVLDKIDTIKVENRLFQRFSFKFETKIGDVKLKGVNDGEIWVNGVGNDMGILSLMKVGTNIVTEPRGKEEMAFEDKVKVVFPVFLEGCYENGELIFSGYDLQKNAITGIKDIRDTNTDNGTIYDLQGRMVLKPKKGAIYIKNGRKLLWK